MPANIASNGVASSGANATKLPGGAKHFELQLSEPDVVGPVRIPRAGGATPTGLAMDKTLVTITGSTTNVIQGAFMSTTANNNWGTTNVSTAAATNTTSTTAAFGTQYPLLSTYADQANLVSSSFVVYYTGNPLNVAGEAIFFTMPSGFNSNSVSYASCWLYPNVARMPIADLIDAPVRVFSTKMGPGADDFIALTDNAADTMVPCVLFNGLPNGQTINIEVVRNWEYVTKPSSGGTALYEMVSPSYSKDESWYQDAVATLGRLASTVTSVIEAPLTQQMIGIAAKALPLMLSRPPMTQFHMAKDMQQGRIMRELKRNVPDPLPVNPPFTEDEIDTQHQPNTLRGVTNRSDPDNQSPSPGARMSKRYF